MSLRGPPQAGRGNLNRDILDCFVAKLLAMTPATQLIRRERLQCLSQAVCTNSIYDSRLPESVIPAKLVLDLIGEQESRPSVKFAAITF